MAAPETTGISDTKDRGEIESQTISRSVPDTSPNYETSEPTASHALAEASVTERPEEVAEKGASQVEHDEVEVKNIGWNAEAQSVPDPVVGGLENAETWTLIRRFDKQVFHVKSIQSPPLANLDMNVARERQFSPDKLRAQLERMYVSVVVPLFTFSKHIVRLRSWKEPRRTAWFLAVYSTAWLFDLLVPTTVAFALLLILCRQARVICFPPVPPSIVDSSTGGVQNPPAGNLASDDSVTGAPETQDGEAVEEEARNVVNSIGTLALSTSAGKDPQHDPDDKDDAPDPTQIAEEISGARDKTGGEDPNVSHDKTKAPMSQVVSAKMNPTLSMINDFVDTWERFGNALSPTPPFPTHRPQLTLAACLLPILILSYFITPYMLLKGLAFGAGFGFFGDPIITRGIEIISRKYPGWKTYMELRHTVLRGIPTNVQLAITLLRIGETSKTPLPPPPSSDRPLSHGPTAKAASEAQNLGAHPPEISEAVQTKPEQEREKEPTDVADPQPKKSHRILNALKVAVKGGIQAGLTADRAKATAGVQHARDRLGVVKHSIPDQHAGPVQFPARYNGHNGHVYVTATATSPAVSWTASLEDVDPAWTVAVRDIDELKKVGGLGWKSKVIVGWASEKQIVDGLVVKTKQGKEFHLTAITLRDELFNRLIAIGRHMWESL